MRTLIDWLTARLRRRVRLSYHLHDADGTIEIRQGWHTVRLSHSDYLLLQQLKGWQQ